MLTRYSEGQTYLQSAGINDKADISNRQARLCNVGGDDNLAHSMGRLAEGLTLLSRGDGGVQRDNPPPVLVAGCSCQPLYKL